MLVWQLSPSFLGICSCEFVLRWLFDGVPDTQGFALRRRKFEAAQCVEARLGAGVHGSGAWIMRRCVFQFCGYRKISECV
jgi:hypothetical protein